MKSQSVDYLLDALATESFLFKKGRMKKEGQEINEKKKKEKKKIMMKKIYSEESSSEI